MMIMRPGMRGAYPAAAAGGPQPIPSTQLVPSSGGQPMGQQGGQANATTSIAAALNQHHSGAAMMRGPGGQVSVPGVLLIAPRSMHVYCSYHYIYARVAIKIFSAAILFPTCLRLV